MINPLKGNHRMLIGCFLFYKARAIDRRETHLWIISTSLSRSEPGTHRCWVVMYKTFRKACSRRWCANNVAKNRNIERIKLVCSKSHWARSGKWRCTSIVWNSYSKISQNPEYSINSIIPNPVSSKLEWVKLQNNVIQIRNTQIRGIDHNKFHGPEIT